MFAPLFSQMLVLFSLILLGYILVRLKLLPDNTQAVLSKLENYLFIPALVLGTFIGNFTVDKLQSAGRLLLFSALIEAIVLPLSFLCVRLITKDKYIRRIYLYGLAFSNFGFVGNALVQSMFPDVFFEYVIFTLVLWVVIYLWGVPCLLIDEEDGEEGKGKRSIAARLKNFLNPMFISAIVGMAIGLTGLAVPKFATDLISSLSACMSPIAMLITGMTIAKIDILKVLKIKSIWAVSALRLLAYPLLFVGAYYLFGLRLEENFVICALVSLAMPLGLNTIVVPAAYGKDTTVASGMALISHVLGVLTIPLVMSLISF